MFFFHLLSKSQKEPFLFILERCRATQHCPIHSRKHKVLLVAKRNCPLDAIGALLDRLARVGQVSLIYQSRLAGCTREALPGGDANGWWGPGVEGDWRRWERAWWPRGGVNVGIISATAFPYPAPTGAPCFGLNKLDGN